MKRRGVANMLWGNVKVPNNGLPDAPADGIIYGRKDNEWVQVISGGGGENAYIVYNESQLLSAYADAISHVGKGATIYIGATITLTANRSFKRSNSDAKIEFYGIGTSQQIAIGNFTFSINNITFRNISFSTTGSVYVTVDGCYANFYSCRWIDEQFYSTWFHTMKIAIKCIGTIVSGTGQIYLDDVYHASRLNYSINAGDIQPFIIQNATAWGASTDNFYINIVRMQALMNYDTVARVLLHSISFNAPFKVTGDLTWHYHPDQAMPGTGNISVVANILKRGSVDDLRGDLIAEGEVISLIGIDLNKKIRKRTGTIQLEKATGAEINIGTNNVKYVTPKAINDAKIVGIHIGTTPPEDTSLLWLDTN